jgi:long-chain acyl-CoA synthetase
MCRAVTAASIDGMSGSSMSARPALAVERSTHAATLGAMVAAATERHTGTALRFPVDGVFVEWSYEELGRRARELARGLIAFGIEPGDRVGVLANTRAEWTLVDCAILLAGAVAVPVYQTSSAEETAYVLDHSGARAVVCENLAQLDKVRTVREDCPALEQIITMEPTGEVPSIEDLRGRAEEVDPADLDERVRAARPDDLATIVYTSGTTGPPKGCMISHANLLSTMEMYDLRLELRNSAVIFIFLPLAHVLARMTQFVTLDVGATLSYWGGDPTQLVEDIAAAEPTHVPSVPRVFEKIHTKALAGVEDEGGVKKRVFDWAIGVGARHANAGHGGDGPGVLLRAEHALADRLVLSKVRALFGPRFEMALTGAAPIAKDVLEFFEACGIVIYEGYGMTETCAAATLNIPSAYRFGTVGTPLPRSEVRIADDGEILMRGPHVFKGYFRNPTATHETFDGDWLRSGDLGSIDADGFLHITGRKKDLIITSSGKNIAPANLESALRESRWISQAVVHGDDRPYLVALLTLDPEEAPALAKQLGIDPDIPAMAEHDGVRAALQREVDQVNSRFARIEQIKRFGVLDHDLTQAAGELTPTLKVKRAVVSKRYGERFDELYR